MMDISRDRTMVRVVFPNYTALWLSEEHIVQNEGTVTRLINEDNKVKIFDDPVANSLVKKLLREIVTGKK